MAALTADGLTRRFGDRVAVDGLTFEVPSGGLVGFVGPNGSGKSTTIRMLLGLISPSAGAHLTHNSALAIGIGIGYLLVFESLIGIVAPHASPYLPAGSLNALVMGGTIQLAWAAALGLVILYGTIAGVVAFLSLQTRDIVS